MAPLLRISLRIGALVTTLIIVVAVGYVFWPKEYVGTVTLVGPSIAPNQFRPPHRGGYGPARDVEGARAAELSRWRHGVVAIPDVTVVGSYALITWETDKAGGQSLYVKKQGGWVLLTDGGGLIDQGILVDNGVPSQVAHELIEHNFMSAEAERLRIIHPGQT